MSGYPKSRRIVRSALLLFGLLATALAITIMKRDEVELVTLQRLTPLGVQIESLRTTDQTTLYEELLQEAVPTSWPIALWHRLRRHGALQRSQLMAREGDLLGAERQLREFLAKRPFDTVTLWRLAEVATARDAPATVVEAANAVLDLSPGFGPALLRRAHARHLMGNELAALHDFMSALERPLNIEDFTLAATSTLQLLIDRGEPETARHYASRLREGAEIPQAASLLGYAAHALGEHEEAATHFRNALEQGFSEDLTLALARSLELGGKPQEALELLLEVHFEGRKEQERWRILSRLAGELDLQVLAIEAANEALERGDDPELRLELAQRLLDRRPLSREASERAWLLLIDQEQMPCTNGLQDTTRCRRLAAEALGRLGRNEELTALLRASLSASTDLELLARLAMALLASDRPEGALLLASLATVAENDQAGDYHRDWAAEALLSAGAANLSLSLLDIQSSHSGDNRNRDLEIYAAQQAGDWERLRRLLEAEPRRPDGLPERDGHAGTYCDALAALGSSALSSCLARLTKRRPVDAALRYRIAALARERGDLEEARTWLEAATRLRPDPRWLLELGFLLTNLKHSRQAEEVFRAAQEAGAGSEAEIALAYSLAGRGRSGAAVHHLRQALAKADLSVPQRLPALELLAELLQQAGAPARAADALQQALELEEDPERRLRLARAQYEAGLTIVAKATLQEIERDALGTEASLFWFDLSADLAHSEGKLEVALQMRQAAAALGPTASRHELLASAFLLRDEAGDHNAAREHLAIAIALTERPSPSLLARLAYLDQAAGEIGRAELLLREAVRQAPQVQEYREDLAQLLASQGQRAEALPLLRTALEMADDHPHADQDYRRERVAQLQAQYVASNRRWRFHWLETFCFGGKNDCLRPSLTSAGDSIGQGQAEVGFIPFLSHRFGLVELTARVNWDRAPGKFAPRSRYLQGAVGFRYKPLQDHDLWVGSERLQAIGPGGRNDWRLFASYGWSHGRKWSSVGHGLRPFVSVYGDIGRNFGGAEERSASADIQVGLRGQRGETFAYLPFIYLASGREHSRDLAFYRYEGGIGISSEWRLAKSLYEGYLTTASLSLRLGHERDTRGQGSTRGILSFGLRY